MNAPSAPETLVAELDRCVKCGMCLAECPTYRLEADENESPRGRLALIEGLIQGRLEADRSLTAHLDHCLGCRRCERVCPSQVKYGHLLDQARGLLADARPRRRSSLLHDPARMQLGSRIARSIPTALSAPFGTAHRLHRLATALGSSEAPPAPGIYQASSQRPRGHVGLFRGCATSAQQGGALHAALHLLQYTGHEVSIASGDLCCGALSHHAGDRRKAAAWAAKVRSLYEGDVDTVISIASGCGNQLDSYQPPLSTRHQDICRFLLEHGELTGDDFYALDTRVFLHVPCSVENVYRGADWARRLLELIPLMQIVPLGEAGQCCGAAGDYMLRYPEHAQQLRQPLLESLPNDPGLVLLTSNIGCAMHLADGLLGRNVEVLHPVELLGRQLRD